MFAKFDPLWGTIFGGPFLPLLAAKIGLGDQFYCQNRSGGPILGGTDFGVRELHNYLLGAHNIYSFSIVRLIVKAESKPRASKYST